MNTERKTAFLETNQKAVIYRSVSKVYLETILLSVKDGDGKHSLKLISSPMRLRELIGSKIVDRIERERVLKNLTETFTSNSWNNEKELKITSTELIITAPKVSYTCSTNTI